MSQCLCRFISMVCRFGHSGLSVFYLSGLSFYFSGQSLYLSGLSFNLGGLSFYRSGR